MLILPLDLTCSRRSRPELKQASSVNFRSKRLSITCRYPTVIDAQPPAQQEQPVVDVATLN